MHSKKFFEYVRLVLKVFLSVEYRNILEYTFEFFFFGSCLAISNLFQGVYFENNHEYTLEKII